MLNYLICPRANKRCKVTTFFSNGNDFQKKHSIREINAPGNAPGKALPYTPPWSVYAPYCCITILLTAFA